MKRPKFFISDWDRTFIVSEADMGRQKRNEGVFSFEFLSKECREKFLTSSKVILYRRNGKVDIIKNRYGV